MRMDGRTMKMSRWISGFALVLCAALAHAQQAQTAPLRAPDVPYEPSETRVVRTMLDMAKVGANDVVFDLGCGDGRIVIAAAKERGARSVCVDIDPQRIAEARENARKAGVADKIEFLTQDLFQTDISRATVVMLYLWPHINLQLRPKLLAELKPGTRVVSHLHTMGDWKPERIVRVRVDGRDRPIHFWTIPKR